ncbi:L10-interacting MYB domain-containing protein-like [Populus nigra]|uniref:L10-interacting MYB domain-containing protein-like n=1 Tax=Populus nigra TaxID=3691 RepID=UPI002B27382A|nr:L10-interacting MYB domain-containing protein-like [Populus nigra]
MDNPETIDKAAWNKEILHVFYDLCIKAIDMGMRPNTHFDKAGWKYLLTSFKEQTGHAFTKTQLKNKWDGCKKDWRIWTKLISETGVGWSNELGTISASDEWWKAKIQEIRGVKKFRQAAIEPSLRLKFNRMFSNIVTTGEYAWAPSAGVLRDDNIGVVEDSNDNNEQPNLEEGSGDSEEDGIPNFTDDMCNMVRGVNMSSSSNTRSSEKRKARERLDIQAGKKKEVLELGCNYCHEGVHIGNDFHVYATEFLGMRRNREMWSTMGSLENKMKWLQKMFTRRKAP